LAFLHALIAENVAVILVGSTRADDIVRDADILPLYKRAGVARFLMGLESVDGGTLARINKGGTPAKDREAIRLLRQHGMLSMVGFVAGFADETDQNYWRTLRTLMAYDPDQIQALYATPHRWTPWNREVEQRRVVQTDLRRWDYKHQVLAAGRVPAWRMLLWMKCIEAAMQLRPPFLYRVLAHPDLGLRAAMRWYYRIGRRVWPYEVWNFLVRDRRTSRGPTVTGFWSGETD
jgi:anaerobic magnesium-protoporphyrin IX monomethyl ester cyclase